ncbi:MAG: hydrogenase subunit MbhD domain-containing protein [Sulfolobales archaeon]
MEITYLLLAISMLLALIATYLAIVEKHLVKAVVFSAVQSVAFTLALYLLRAPDIVLVYLPITVGIYPAAILFLIKKTEEVEEV